MCIRDSHGGRIGLRERLIFQQGLRMAQRLPQGVTNMRSDRIEQQYDGLERLVAHGAALIAGIGELRDVVEQLLSLIHI